MKIILNLIKLIPLATLSKIFSSQHLGIILSEKQKKLAKIIGVCVCVCDMLKKMNFGKYSQCQI